MSDLTREQIAQIQTALALGRTIEAITIYREATGAGLAEAKDFIEAMPAEPVRKDVNTTEPASVFERRSNIAVHLANLAPSHRAQLETALASGWKLEAIRIYREATGKGLREAKDCIEALILELVKRDPKKFGKLAAGTGDTSTSSGGCGIFLALVGAFALGLAAWVTLAPAVGAQRTMGTVVAVEERYAEPRNAFAPVVEYEAAGNRYRVTGKPVKTSPKIGETLPVLYKADRPSEGRLDTFADRWDPLLLGGTCGVMFMVIGFFIWRSARRCKAALESAAGSSRGQTR